MFRFNYVNIHHQNIKANILCYDSNICMAIGACLKFHAHFSLGSYLLCVIFLLFLYNPFCSSTLIIGTISYSLYYFCQHPRRKVKFLMKFLQASKGLMDPFQKCRQKATAPIDAETNANLERIF